jgi:hypothetical protein
MDIVFRDMSVLVSVTYCKQLNCLVFLQSSVWEFFTKLFKQHEFHEHPLSNSHIFLKGVNEFLSVRFIDNWCSERVTSFTNVNEIMNQIEIKFGTRDVHKQ